MSFTRYDTTLPVKSFVIEQLIKDERIMMYDGYTLSYMEKDLKKKFKSRMDKWIFRKTNWLDVAECVKEKMYEFKKLKE